MVIDVGLGPALVSERMIVIGLVRNIGCAVGGSNMTPALINAIRDSNESKRSTNNHASSPRLKLLNRQRTKLLATLLSHKLSPTRKARLREILANIDQVIIRLLQGLA